MTSPLLQTWPVTPQSGTLYTPLNAGSGPSMIEMSRISESVFVSPKDNIFGESEITDEDSKCPTFSVQHLSNKDLNKALPRPPSRIHPIRYKSMNLWYRRLRRLEGYHFGVLCCAVVAALVMVLNLTLMIWTVSFSDVQNGIGTLQDGSCKRTTTLTFWVHLAINFSEHVAARCE